MIIAQQLRTENRAEYLLYMWQVEDIVRLYDADADRICREYLSRFKVDENECYDSAQKLDWMDENAVDRLGNPRIFSTGPDMGCFESQSGGLMMFVR